MANVLNSAREAGFNAKAKGMAALNSRFPPEKREEISNSIRLWASENPKLAALIATHASLTLPPILVFTLFSLAIFFTSVMTCVFIGLSIALFFTGFCVGLALIFLIPTVFITTITASFIFFWGLVGYLLVRRFRESEKPIPSPEEAGRLLRNAVETSKEQVKHIAPVTNGGLEPRVQNAPSP